MTNAYNHGLMTGDYVTVTTLTTSGSSFNATNVQITKVDANSFTYPLSVSGAPHGYGLLHTHQFVQRTEAEIRRRR